MEVEEENNKNSSGVNSNNAIAKEKMSIEDVVNKVAERPSILYIVMMLGLMSFNIVWIIYRHRELLTSELVRKWTCCATSSIIINFQFKSRRVHWWPISRTLEATFRIPIGNVHQPARVAMIELISLKTEVRASFNNSCYSFWHTLWRVQFEKPIILYKSYESHKYH